MHSKTTWQTAMASAAAVKCMFSFDITGTSGLHMHNYTCQHLSAIRCWQLTTNKNVFLTLAEGLLVFSSLVVFPFSFSQVVQWFHCWKNDMK